MNFIELESEQKLSGGYNTEPFIASFLVRWIKQINPRHILEPSCGDGVFFAEIEKHRIEGIEKIIGCEISKRKAHEASKRSDLPVEILNTDFLRWYLSDSSKYEQFDAVVGNPPFIRYQYLPREMQLLSEKIFQQLQLPFTKHTNAWVPFVIASVRLLRPGGRIAMVIPSEIFHIPHARSLRRYLAEQCNKVLIIDPEEIWFTDTLQGTVLLLAEKKQNDESVSAGISVVSLKGREVVSNDPESYFSKATYWTSSDLDEKWMPLFLSATERDLLAESASRESISRFVDVASVDVGIVTGANSFFLVPDSTVEEYDLHKWAHPMFGRSNHVKGLMYSLKDHQSNKDTGLPANFLWFDEDNIHELSKKAQEYLKTGTEQNIHTRYKCRTRKVWYTVPSVYVSPIAMLKRAHHYPRLVLNKAGAYTTDTAYRITPTTIKPITLVYNFVNSLTCLSAELEGRHYGGGVLELVPSEIERLLIPTVNITAKELTKADKVFRSEVDSAEFLHSHSIEILNKCRFTKAEQKTLFDAWKRLRDRRHRNTAPIESK